MRKQFLSFLFILFIAGASAQSTVDILHYKFSLELSDSSNLIHGRAAIRLKALGSLSSFSVDLSKEKQGKGMTVSGIYEGEQEANKLAFTTTDDQVTINFSDPVKKGEERLVTIVYEGVPSDGLIISKNKYGDRTFFADNWPNRAHNWIPCVDR